MNNSTMIKKDNLIFEQPTKYDGKDMWELVKRSTLDLNSAYKYLMMAEYFSGTCIVAKENDELVGFIAGFIEPEKPDTVFVWQVGVDASQRGRGVASRMLDALLESPACEKVKYLEATITDDNHASQKLFKGLARKMDTSCEVFETFPEEAFPDGHDAEFTYRIGPLSK